jgi:hypothetical protein
MLPAPNTRPKIEKKEYQLIYEIVTLNQTMTSAIASIASSTIKTTSASEFNVDQKSNTLQLSCDSLDDTEIEKKR